MVSKKKEIADSTTHILLLAFQDEVKEDMKEVLLDLKDLSISQATLKGELNGLSTSFQSHLDGDVTKYGHLFEIKDILAKNTFILEENTKDIAHHIKRCDALEERIEQFAQPISLMEFIKKTGVIFAAVAAALAIFKFFKH